MKNLDVAHYLDIYTIRKSMQDDGTTNPSEAIKEFTTEFVDILKTYPLDEEIILKDNGTFYDSKGRFLIKFPD